MVFVVASASTAKPVMLTTVPLAEFSAMVLAVASPSETAPTSNSSRSLMLMVKTVSAVDPSAEVARTVIFLEAPSVSRLSADAVGRYVVSLPDGEWTVKVANPVGRVYEVSQLTVKAGQIHDDQGRDIPTLTIRR